VNVGAVGLVKTAKNVKNAKLYAEFLLTPEIQKRIANGTYEYPINFDMTLNPLHQKWGSFKPDLQTFAQMEEYQSRVGKIIDAGGWK
jgi:iron(III) transport system substrate-binding protein